MNYLFKPFTHFLLSGCLFSHWFVSSPLEIKGIGPFQLHMPLPFAERTNLCAQTLPRLPRPSRCVPRTAGARQVRRCRGAERVTLAEMRRTSDSTLFRLGRGQKQDSDGSQMSHGGTCRPGGGVGNGVRASVPTLWERGGNHRRCCSPSANGRRAPG